MRRLRAAWILPVTAPPIAGGALVVGTDGLIDAVGPAFELAERYRDLPETDLGEVVVVPGLVDAHCHLEWSLTGGLLTADEFAPWLGRMLALRGRVAEGDPPRAAALGALRCLEAGTTTVLDSGPAGAGAAALAEAGLRGVCHLEIFGRQAGRDATAVATAYAERLAALDDVAGGRVAVGVSPHAPYSVGPGLWAALGARGDLAGRRWATHLAESPAEAQLAGRGDGPLAELFADLGIVPGDWPEAPGASAVARVEAAGGLRPGLVAAHAVALAPDDPARLGAAGVAVAHCPRSNAYLCCGVAPLPALERAGVAIALGTDSPASGGGYDVRAEARACALAQAAAATGPPHPAALLRMATLGGACALGREHELGSLEPGKRADLVAIRPAAGGEPRGDADPVRAALASGARVEAVIVDGEPLLWDGRHQRLDRERVLAHAREPRARLC